MTTADASIGAKIEDAGRGAILIFNKWDLIEGREAEAKELELVAREKMPHLSFAPIVYLSAATGRGMKSLFPRIREVREQQLVRVPTPELNRFLEAAAARLPPRAKDGKEVKFYYIAQTGVSPPRFVLTVTLAAEGGGTRIGWSQCFETVELRQALQAICIPANEQNLDRLARVRAAGAP